ncbi:MAG: hypothetical protein IKF64_00080 [Eubacterium sp.]|nr:hypothetical protein [Eubacterium sp.]
MKKTITLVLSAVMLISVLAFATTAFAAPVASPEHPSQSQDITTEVNGNESDDVIITRDPTDPTKITFEYTGDGKLVDWEFPGMVEGKDYKIVSREGNKITIQLLNGYSGKIVANAIVEETTEAPDSEKQNKGKKSPKTGAGAATAVAVAGAGIAVLAAARKKNED